MNTHKLKVDFPQFNTKVYQVYLSIAAIFIYYQFKSQII